MTRAATPYPQAARGLLRDTVLDALRAELAERDWSEVSMAAVAGGAGVSRQTLYNAFGGRDELAQAFVLRESERFLAAVDAAVAARASDPAAALRDAFAVVLEAAASDPVVRAALRPAHDGTGLLAHVTTQGRPLVSFATEHLTGTLAATWPALDPGDAALLAEGLVRLAISYAALPGGDDADTAEAVTRLLGPFVEQRVTPGRRP